MASTKSPHSSLLIFLSLTPCLFLIFAPQNIQAQSAPAPEPPGPINLTQILEKRGQFTTFIRLLNTTQISNQITNQLNSSTEGMTVFAPTDNAFNNLKPGTLNGLSVQQQVQLVLYHVLPKYYSLVMFQTVSNPVRTQATGQDGGIFGLNFTSTGNNQVNISTGVVETQLNNAIRQNFPLAVYQVDQVLLPFDLFGPKPNSSATPPSAGPSGSSDTKSPGSSSGDAPDKENSGPKEKQIGLGLVGAGIGLVCMGVLF